MIQEKQSPIVRAVAAQGGYARFVTDVNALIGDGIVPLTSQRVYNWCKRKTKVPAEYVAAIESVTGVSKHDLRPDVYRKATV